MACISSPYLSCFCYEIVFSVLHVLKCLCMWLVWSGRFSKRIYYVRCIHLLCVILWVHVAGCSGNRIFHVSHLYFVCSQFCLLFFLLYVVLVLCSLPCACAVCSITRLLLFSLFVFLLL